MAVLLFRLEQRQEPETLACLIDETIAWFRCLPGYDGLKRLFTELVHEALNGIGVTAHIPGDLQETRTMLSTLGESWKHRWKAEGKAEGKVEGQARAQLRQLERRFGPMSDEVRTRVTAADLDTLDDWLDRVHDAPTLEAVFDDGISH